MLAPDDRAVLLDLLRPPVGHSLERAVGTTFTLDLEAALAVPLAFASHRLSSTTDPIVVMESVRAAAARVDLFCQAGQITVPTQASDLMAFLEPMVHEVVAPRPGHLFHPKVWFLHFTPDEDPDQPHPLRFLCLTRNLTGDASWDAAVRLDGWAMTRPSTENRPLVDLLRALSDLAVRTLPEERRAAIEELAGWFHHAEWEWPDGVSSGAFHALGLRRRAPVPDMAGRRRVVVAPFCNDAGLGVVAPGGHVTLVSEARDLERLAPDTLARVEAYVVSPTADLGEPADGDDDAGGESAAADRVLRGGLHAKLTVIERARQAIVLLGSANATDAAYGGNVEVLVEMRGSPAKLGVTALLDTQNGLGQIIERYQPDGGAAVDPDEAALWELQRLLRSTAALGWTVTATGGPDEWGLTVASSRPVGTQGARLTAEIMGRPGRTLVLADGSTDHGTLSAVPTADISPFLVLRAVRDDPAGPLQWSCIVRAELVDDPATRLDEVLARQIDTPEKLLRFLMLVLGLGRLELVALQAGSDGGAAGWSFGSSSTGLFEAVVRAVAEQPRGFDDLVHLVDRLRATDRGRAALPPGFDGLWTAACTAHERITSRSDLGPGGPR